jgi:SAM-dependent methyltransferase
MTTGSTWQHLESCPACNGTATVDYGRLTKRKYQFGSMTIAVPAQLRLVGCGTCGLVYKTIVPTPEWLSSLTASSEHELWQSAYGFDQELAVIRSHAPPKFALLDVGAATGQFLSAAQNFASRRSALDIVRFSGLSISDDGEFIKGFLDEDALVWSGVKYDVVTTIDTMEHLYNPARAMENLASFVSPGGLLMIETGNADSVSRLDRWYYLTLFEHHMAWNRKSLSALAGRFGFDVVSISELQHRNAGMKLSGPAIVRYYAYRTNPSLYHVLQKSLGLDGSVPPKPLIQDHMRVFFRRKSV